MRILLAEFYSELLSRFKKNPFMNVLLYFLLNNFSRLSCPLADLTSNADATLKSRRMGNLHQILLFVRPMQFFVLIRPVFVKNSLVKFCNSKIDSKLNFLRYH